jgi:hypothetical protein
MTTYGQSFVEFTCPVYLANVMQKPLRKTSRGCTTNHTMLDDIVSELWEEENVTSGHCPRYRYPVNCHTLTLGNL